LQTQSQQRAAAVRQIQLASNRNQRIPGQKHSAEKRHRAAQPCDEFVERTPGMNS